MDPPSAAAVLTEAALLRAPGPDGTVMLADASPAQEAFLKGAKSRDPLTTVAKRYFKAKDALIDLERALASVPSSEVKGLVAKKSAGCASTAPCLALVPYVESIPDAQKHTLPITSPVSHVATAEQVAVEIYDRCRGFVVMYSKLPGVSPLLLLLRIFLKLVLFAPVVLGYVTFFYAALLFLHLLRNPELIVKGLFSAADMLPNYVEYAASRIGAATWAEITKRFGF